MTWLVLGAKGQLGQELIHLLKIKNIEATGTDRNEIDFAKPNEIAEKLAKPCSTLERMNSAGAN